ncbi:hypothetical protein R6Q59_032893 [Mikania micrantha]
MDAHKNPNLATTHHHHRIHTSISLPSLQDFKKPHEELLMQNQIQSSDHGHVLIGETSFLAAGEGDHKAEVVVEKSGRERLKKHWVEMSGRVWIPDIWGQEDLLKNWIDCTGFDSCLDKSSIMSARKAMIQEGR